MSRPGPSSRQPALRRIVHAAAAALLLTAAPEPAAAQGDADQVADVADDASERTVVQNGVRAHLEVAPLGGEADAVPRAGQDTRVRLRLNDAESGEPVTDQVPAAWIDRLDAEHVRSQQQCKRRIEQYLPKKMKTRPVIDLNSYVVLGLTRGNVITVQDPFFGFGNTQMITTVRLPGQGTDWTTGPEERVLYVTIPKRNLVAVVSTDTWDVVEEIPVETRPERLVRQPGAERLWVSTAEGVTVVDMVTRQVVGTVETGPGSREIAFRPDGRRAFVANPEAGTVSVVEADRLAVVETLEPGRRPTDLAWSPLSGELYVVDEADGTIHAYEGEGLGLTARMTGTPGLWHIEFDPSGRWGFVLNRNTDEVHVLDASNDRIRYGLLSEGVPDEVAFTENFAYIRSQESSQVMMIGLQSLEPGRAPGAFARDFSSGGEEVDTGEAGVAAVHFPAGDAPPERDGMLPVADPIDQAPHKRDAVYVPNPSEKSIYFNHYMEGMPTPAGNLKTYEFEPIAAMTVGRKLDEVEPGVYEAVVQIPSAGGYEFNFVLEKPRVVDCLPMEVEKGPDGAVDREVSLDLQAASDRKVVAGRADRVRFRLEEYGTGDVRGDLEDLRARVMSPAGWLETFPARPVEGEDSYEVELQVPDPGVYYLTVSVPGLGKGFSDQHPLTLDAHAPGSEAATAGAEADGTASGDPGDGDGRAEGEGPSKGGGGDGS